MADLRAIEATLAGILSELLEAPDLRRFGPDARLDDLGLTDAQRDALIDRIEGAFGITVAGRLFHLLKGFIVDDRLECIALKIAEALEEDEADDGFNPHGSGPVPIGPLGLTHGKDW